MWDVWQNLRFAFRVMWRSPGVTAVAVITLGLGIAANTTVFGWIDTVLPRPIPGLSNASELAAREEARAVAARIAAANPDTHKGIGASLVPMWRASYGLQSWLGNPLRILMAVCVLVLMIACANVANLLMARSVSRQKEFGIRVALGAGRAQLVRQLLTEVMVLAGAGALLGVLLAQWMGESLSYALPALDLPLRSAIEPLLHPKPSGLVLLFTALMAIGTAVVSTLMPALYTVRVNVNETLKEGGRSGSSAGRSHRARGVLVIAEVALASMTLIGAGLAVRSFQKLTRIDLGFEPRNVLVAHFHLSTNGYSLEKERQFSHTLRTRLESSPGIEQVSYAESAPLSMLGAGGERVQSFGSEADKQGVIWVSRSVVAPGYFSLMRIPLLEGRDFTERDTLKAPSVIIVNRTFARKYFAGQDPIGRKVRVSGNWATVIGMVKDSKYRSPAEGPTAFFYGAFEQMFWSGNTNLLYMRARNPDAAGEALRREVAALDPNKGLYELSTLENYTQVGLFGERVVASLLSALGILALALAAAGLYSVMAYAVSERTQEIGIRMALGAGRHQVMGLVLWRGLAMTMAGLVAGAGGAIAGAHVLSSVLGSPVSASEPAVFAFVALALILVALLASYTPARRASQVDPMITLRSQ